MYGLIAGVESLNALGWKEPHSTSGSKPPAMGRDTFHQLRLLKAPSNLALLPPSQEEGCWGTNPSALRMSLCSWLG